MLVGVFFLRRSIMNAVTPEIAAMMMPVIIQSNRSDMGAGIWMVNCLVRTPAFELE